MTFLQLVRRLSQEAQIPGEGPSTVVGQTGENRSLVNWANSAWEEIQMMRPDWQWMKADYDFPLIENQAAYTPAEAGIASRFSSWDTSSVLIYQTSLGLNNSTDLPFIDYNMYRRYYQTNTQAPGRPVIHGVNSDLSLLMGPKPNGLGYTVEGKYFKTIQTLALDADVPEMPEQYHMMIVYLALKKYATAEAAAELYTSAEMEFKKFKNRLSLNQLPAMSMAGATA